MPRDRSRSRSTGGETGTKVSVLLALLLGASAVAGASVTSTSSFSLVQADRGSAVDVVEDENGALGLGINPSIGTGGQSSLVTVTNNLGLDDVDVTVTLITHTNSQLTAGSVSNAGSVTFTLDFGDQQVVEINPTGPPGQLRFEVGATGSGLAATMERTTQVVPTGQVDLEIDIKPGSQTNPINPTSQGVIPVAVMNTTAFDPVHDLNRSTIRFGPEGYPMANGQGASPAHGGHEEDVDGDGDLDLVLHFPTADSSFSAGDSTGELVGLTTDGRTASGTDSVRIVGPPGEDAGDDEDDGDGEDEEEESEDEGEGDEEEEGEDEGEGDEEDEEEDEEDDDDEGDDGDDGEDEGEEEDDEEDDDGEGDDGDDGEDEIDDEDEGEEEDDEDEEDEDDEEEDNEDEEDEDDEEEDNEDEEGENDEDEDDEDEEGEDDGEDEEDGKDDHPGRGRGPGG